MMKQIVLSALLSLVLATGVQAESPAPQPLIEINLGHLLSNLSPHKMAFDLAYKLLNDLSQDPEKVSTYTAQLPHTVHVGDELELVVSAIDDSGTLIFDGLSQSLQAEHLPYRKRIKVRKEGENLILFQISQGMLNPGEWRGDLSVRNLTSGEELIDQRVMGNDFLRPGRQRVYLFRFHARRPWYDWFH